ncbi:MAG: PDZ domain-containing protein [Planctomycetota bacterium]
MRSLSLASFLVLALAAPSLAQERPADAARELSHALEALAERSSRSLVELEVSPPPNLGWARRGMRELRQLLEEHLPPLDPEQDLGLVNAAGGKALGFVVARDGWILANHHMVGAAQRITARLPDGRTLVAKLIGSDPQSDVALIRVPATDLTPFAYGDTKQLKLGQLVLGVGAGGRGMPVYGLGVIGRRAPLDARGTGYDDCLISDAFAPGACHGVLLDLDGALLGLASRTKARPGPCCPVIPAETVQRIAARLMRGEEQRKGFLGVQVQELTPAMAEALNLQGKQGALVREVTPGSPAEQAGIQVGDLIVELDGYRGERGIAWLSEKVEDTKPGTECAARVIRDGKEVKLQVKIGERPARIPTLAQGERAKGEPGALPDLGFEAGALDEATAKRYGYEPGTKGVVVTKVTPDGPAAAAGIEAGFLILRVNQRKVETLEELHDALAEARKHGKVALLARGPHGVSYFALEAEKATGS